MTTTISTMQWIRRDMHTFLHDNPSFSYWERRCENERKMRTMVQFLGRALSLPTDCIDDELVPFLRELPSFSQEEWRLRRMHAHRFRNCLFEFRRCMRTARYRSLRFIEDRRILHWSLQPSVEKKWMRAATCMTCGKYFRSCTIVLPERIQCHCFLFLQEEEE